MDPRISSLGFVVVILIAAYLVTTVDNVTPTPILSIEKEVIEEAQSKINEDTIVYAKPEIISTTTFPVKQTKRYVSPKDEKYGEFGSRDHLIAAINDFRGETLIEDDRLDDAARLKAEDMIAKGYFSHVSPEGRDHQAFIDMTSFRFSYSGENLARGHASLWDVFLGFVDSPTHRDNMLLKSYKNIGAAAVQAPDGVWYVVVLFATPAEN